MTTKVIVAEAIAAAGMASLSDECQVVDATGMDRDQLKVELADAAALIVRSATKVDKELIDAGPRLRVVGRAGIGVDNIDVPAATAAGVLVVNAPNANTISAAEHTMALLLAQARNIPAADASMRSGAWERKAHRGVELSGKTLGLVGLGKIGTLVAQRAAAFGMRVLAHDPFVTEERARRIGVELAGDLETVWGEADFITVHVPLTPGTEGLLDSDAFAAMKPGVRIVNTSRGGVVDEDALAGAVRSGIVAGAALDVFAEEPLRESPLREMPEVILTPHLGASTAEAQDKAGIAVAEAVLEALRGELVLSAVNVDFGPDVADSVRPYLPVASQLGKIFVALAGGLPDRLVVEARGVVGETPRPLALAALQGALAGVSADEVSFVKAPALAATRGVEVEERASTESQDYVSLVRVSGTVGGTDHAVAATLLARKGPVLVDILAHEIELPITRYLLVVRNEDVPGVIGRVGTYLGDEQVNIANMVVGRDPTGAAALMGLNLDSALSDDQVEGLAALEGIRDARFIDLG